MTRRHRFGVDPCRPTFLAFHAHPDDEAIFTGGTLALARAAGWRTVVVFATGGELGAGPGADHRTVAAARRREAERAGEILGVDAVELLGFRDSGMAGSTDNQHPGCLAAADGAEAADRLALMVERYAVTALSSYDPAGVPVALDVAEVLDTKRRSIAAHASQVLVNDFIGIPAGAFERLISREWFVCPDGAGQGRLLADLSPSTVTG